VRTQGFGRGYYILLQSYSRKSKLLQVADVISYMEKEIHSSAGQAGLQHCSHKSSIPPLLHHHSIMYTKQPINHPLVIASPHFLAENAAPFPRVKHDIGHRLEVCILTGGILTEQQLSSSEAFAEGSGGTFCMDHHGLTCQNPALGRKSCLRHNCGSLP